MWVLLFMKYEYSSCPMKIFCERSNDFYCDQLLVCAIFWEVKAAYFDIDKSKGNHSVRKNLAQSRIITPGNQVEHFSQLRKILFSSQLTCLELKMCLNTFKQIWTTTCNYWRKKLETILFERVFHIANFFSIHGGLWWKFLIIFTCRLSSHPRNIIPMSYC